MSTKTTSTPHFFEKFHLKVPFNVNGNLGLIKRLCEDGVIVRVDATCHTACACYDNEIDYNDFKHKLGVA